MQPHRSEDVVRGVLDQMDHHARRTRMAIRFAIVDAAGDRRGPRDPHWDGEVAHRVWAHVPSTVMGYVADLADRE